MKEYDNFARRLYYLIFFYFERTEINTYKEKRSRFKILLISQFFFCIIIIFLVAIFLLLYVHCNCKWIIF